MVLRQRPIKLARSPIRAGNSASIRSRTRRATTGDAPPVPIADHHVAAIDDRRNDEARMREDRPSH